MAKITIEGARFMSVNQIDGKPSLSITDRDGTEITLNLDGWASKLATQLSGLKTEQEA